MHNSVCTTDPREIVGNRLPDSLNAKSVIDISTGVVDNAKHPAENPASTNGDLTLRCWGGGPRQGTDRMMVWFHHFDLNPSNLVSKYLPHPRNCPLTYSVGQAPRATSQSP